MASAGCGSAPSPGTPATTAQPCQWQVETHPPAPALNQVWFVSPERALGIDSACLWSSEDGARTWHTRYCQESRESAGGLGQLWVVSDQEMWMLAGSRLVMHSQDGGVTWRSQEIEGVLVRSVAFASARIGWLVGARLMAGVPDARGVIYGSTDRGLTWTERPTGVSMDDRWWLSDVWPLSPAEVWVVGDALLRSSDGGATWRAPPMPAPALERMLLTRRPSSIEFVNASTGWIEQTPDDHTFWVTGDGGQSFDARPLPGRVARGVVFTSSTHAWVIADGGEHPGVYASTDAGRSWQVSLPDPEPWAGSRVYTHLAFVREHDTLVAMGKERVARCRLR
jgi:photosystem II stability/assembly factor-like uncharacterized protein